MNACAPNVYAFVTAYAFGFIMGGIVIGAIVSMVSERRANKASAKNSLIRNNAARDPLYAPYCLACTTMRRMNIIERFLWRCGRCGAWHDERTDGEKA